MVVVAATEQQLLNIMTRINFIIKSLEERTFAFMC
jgi:hypothetical protein